LKLSLETASLNARVLVYYGRERFA